MTTKDNARAEIVEQRHRDAAANLMSEQFIGIPALDGDAAWSETVRRGEDDSYPIVQAFARFEREHMHPATPPASAGEVERVTSAMAREMYGPNFDPFQNPEAWDLMERLARVALSAVVENSRGGKIAPAPEREEKRCPTCGAEEGHPYGYSNPACRPAPERPEPVENGDLVRRIRYILDAPTAKERMERRNHLTLHDLRRCLAALTLPANAGAGDSGEEIDRGFALDPYDAGLLNDFGGGDVDWWQDYIRAELQRAYEDYASQVDSYLEVRFAEAIAALSPAAGREGEI